MSFQGVSAPEPEADDLAETQIGRRCAPRLPVRVPARFGIGEVTLDVVVTDVSATGARLHMPAPPAVGQAGILSWDGIDCPCRVAWRRKDSCGIAFEGAIAALDHLTKRAAGSKAQPPAMPLVHIADPQPWLAQPPLGPRRSIERPAEVRQGDAWIKVVLRGISQHGFEIGWFPRCKEQSPISLRGPGLPLLHGRVVASDQVLVKCKLRAPLHDAVLRHISAQIGINL